MAALTIVTHKAWMPPAIRAPLVAYVSGLGPTSMRQNLGLDVRVDSTPWQAAVVSAARAQIGVTVSYDPAYTALAFPNGDVPRAKGVCTDVVIRALRDAHGIDLQEQVNDDMKSAFSVYPDLWGHSKPDTNIDHRRVPNLRTYLTRQGASLPVSQSPKNYLPGDIVTWRFASGLVHIGIVSDAVTRGGIPKIIHNAGSGTREQNMLFSYPITGHYRLMSSGT